MKTDSIYLSISLIQWQKKTWLVPYTTQQLIISHTIASSALVFHGKIRLLTKRLGQIHNNSYALHLPHRDLIWFHCEEISPLYKVACTSLFFTLRRISRRLFILFVLLNTPVSYAPHHPSPPTSIKSAFDYPPPVISLLSLPAAPPLPVYCLV